MFCSVRANTVKHEEKGAMGSFFLYMSLHFAGFSARRVLHAYSSVLRRVPKQRKNIWKNKHMGPFFVDFIAFYCVFPEGAVCMRIVAFCELMRHV